MNKFFYLIILLTFGVVKLEAQERNKIEYSISAGFNIGGRTPIGLPAEIRKVDKFAPMVNLSVGANATKMMSSKWGISSGLRFETKGMETVARVRNYKISMNINTGDNLGQHTGYYTGVIENRSKCDYLTIPIGGVFRPNNKWELKGGVYASYALSTLFSGSTQEGTIRESPLHPAIGVVSANYDYSSDVRRYDIGAEFGANFQIYRSLFVTGTLLWGFVDTLNPKTRQIDISTYNIFLNLGLSYRL